MIHEHPQFKLIVCPQVIHYDSQQNLLYKIVLILAFTNIWLSIPIVFIMFMHAITIRIAHVDHTMTETHNTPTPILFDPSLRYQFFGIATSGLTSKQHPHFSHNDLSLSIRITFQLSLSE